MLFAFNFAGFNQIKGLSAAVKKSDTSKEQITQLFNGLPFVGYRYRGRTEAKNIASVKSSTAVNSYPHGSNDEAIYALQSEVPMHPIDSQVIDSVISNWGDKSHWW
jgi:hypothetical protein